MFLGDFRILTGTNACAALIALLAIYFARGRIIKPLTYVLALFVVPGILGSSYVFYGTLGDLSFRIAPAYPIFLGFSLAMIFCYTALQFASEWFLHKEFEKEDNAAKIKADAQWRD